MTATMDQRIKALVAAVRFFQSWKHPRGRDGKFIERGGLIDVQMPGRKKRRAKIVKLTEDGPRVEYKDTGEFQTIPLSDVAKTVTKVQDAKARLPGEAHHDPVSGKIIVQDESNELAKLVFDRARREETVITKELTDLIEGKGEFFGFENRLKEERSIAVRIERNVAANGYSRSEAADVVGDSVRYTIHFPDESYAADTQAVIDRLGQKNAKLFVWNAWTDPDTGYNGTNVTVTRDDGFVYEIQFHTPQSQQVKDETHTVYEAQKKVRLGSDAWITYQKQMQDISQKLVPPPGVENIKIPEGVVQSAGVDVGVWDAIQSSTSSWVDIFQGS